MPGAKKGIVWASVLALALLLSVPFLADPLLNLKPVKTFIAGQIRNRTGVALDLSDLSITLSPLPRLHLMNQHLQLPMGLDLAIEAVHVDLDLKRLLHRQIDVKRIRLRRPVIRYTGPKKEIGGTGILKSDLSPKRIKALFDLLPESQGDLALFAEKGSSKIFNSMDLQCRVLTGEKQARLTADITGVTLDRSIFSAIPEWKAKALKADKIAVKAFLDDTGTLNVTLLVHHFRLETPGTKPMTADTLTLTLALSDRQFQARLVPGTFSYPKGIAGVDFSMDKKSLSTALIFSGKGIDIGQARTVFAPLLSGIRVSDHLFDILRDGRATNITVGFKSATPSELFHTDSLFIRGNATSARVKIPQTPLTATGVSARVTMNRGVLHIEPSRGQVRSSQLLTGKLSIQLDDPSHVPFYGRFSLSADLAELPRALQDLLPDTALAREMTRISGAQGSAHGILTLDRPPSQNAVDVSVTADRIQGSCEYDRLPRKISVSGGTFSLKNGVVTLKKISGLIGDNPVTNLCARITTENTPMIDLKSAAGEICIADLLPWIQEHQALSARIAPVRDMSGTLTVDSLSVNGPFFVPEQWSVRAQGSVRNLAIDFKDHPKAFVNLQGRFQLTDEIISATGITFGIRDLGWLNFAFSPESLDSVKLPLTVQEGSILRKEGKIHIHAVINSPEGPRVSLDLSGDHLRTVIPTWIGLDDKEKTHVMFIPYHTEDKPLMSVDGRLATSSIEKLLNRDSFLDRKLQALTAGNLVTLFTDGHSDLHLETGTLNLDALSPSKGRIPGTPFTGGKNRPLLAHKNLFLKADHLIFHGRDFSSVDAQIRFDQGITKVDIRRAELCGLTGAGTLTLGYNDTTPHVTNDLRITAADPEDVSGPAACLLNIDSLITGEYTLSAGLKGQGSRQEITRLQNGTVKFTARNGRIYRATLLSRILSLINLIGDTDLHQEGFAYRTLAVDAGIKKSVIHIKKAFINAENMAIIASGQIDPLNDHMDITFLVAPFKTIDTIIQHIPVVNTILSGRLASFPVRASGTLSDPDVVPLDPSAVGMGLINMVKDLVNAPSRLLQGNSE